MKPTAWRRKAWTWFAAAGLTASGFAFDQVRADGPRAWFGGLAPTTASADAGPKSTAEALTILESPTSTPASRVQALGILSTPGWQKDAGIEEAIVRALRGDKNESVRVHAAQVLHDARVIPAEAHKALQIAFAANSIDHFPAERSQAVRSLAMQALKRHPRPVIFNAERRTTATILPAGHEVASPPTTRVEAPRSESGVIVLGAPTPTMSAPCACDATPTKPAAPARPRWFSGFGAKNARSATAAQEVVTIVESPTATPQPVAQVAPPAVPAPTALPAPTTQAAPVTPTAATQPSAASLPSQASPGYWGTMMPSTELPAAGPVNLKDRRQSLRTEGLSDPTMRTFVTQTGANPPTAPAAKTESTGPIRRWLSERP